MANLILEQNNPANSPTILSLGATGGPALDIHGRSRALTVDGTGTALTSIANPPNPKKDVAIGLLAIGNGTKSTGVLGQSDLGTGVRAFGGSVGLQASASPVGGTAVNADGGFVGVSATGMIAGVQARGNSFAVAANAPTGIGVLGTGRFGGVFNSLVVTGFKHSAIPDKGGRHRLLYAVESPECWFEDFGSGATRSGRATVRISLDFAGLVRTNAYHVFITPEGDCNGLYVTAKRPGSFEVRELGGGHSRVRFSYRIVARRKDIAGPRLPSVKLPDASSVTGDMPTGDVLRKAAVKKSTRRRSS